MIYIIKLEGLYPNNVNSSLISTRNCKMWGCPSFGVAGQSMCYLDLDGMVTMGPLQLVIIFMWCKTGLTAEYPAT